MLPLLVLLGTISGAWYLLIVRPQRDQQTRHGRLVERLQVDDHVLTVGGILGRVTAIDGAGIELELGPGMSTRIVSDAIARIVPAHEAPPRTTPDTTDALMQQHDQHQSHTPQPYAQPMQPQPQPVYAAPTYAAPMMPAPVVQQPMQYQQPVVQHAPQPYAQPSPYAMPQHAMPQYAAPQPVHHAPAPQAAAPRPWGDVAPLNQPIPVQQPFAAVPSLLAPAPAPSMAPAPPLQAPMPQYSVQTHALPAQPMYHAVTQPVGVPAPTPESNDRRHSRAPKGMGSSLRLDDPSLRDTIHRAREERAQLAGEYRKLTAPLVELEEQQFVAQQQPMAVGMHVQQQSPLYAAPQAAAPQHAYPAPLRPVQVDAQGTSGMPRPVFAQTDAVVDPALQRSAFQRRTPWSPQSREAAPAPAGFQPPQVPVLPA